MYDPDRWRHAGVHWHAYVEARDGHDHRTHTTRETRLTRPPDVVMREPEGVAEWIASMTREHITPRTVRLIGPQGGEGNLGDRGHVEHDLAGNLDALSQGDSLYVDLPRESDRLHLWVEAVTVEECPGVHGEQD